MTLIVILLSSHAEWLSHPYGIAALYTDTGLILGLHATDKRRGYKVKPSLIIS